jgi:flagellin
MTSINTNVGALKAQQNMLENSRDLDQAMARISSGKRINSAADDAAGSAIASKMDSQIRSLEVAVRNSNDAISMTQTAEGALGETESILQRIRELSVQAGNSTLSDSDRVMIQSEVDSLMKEIDSIAGKTNFNGVNLLDGSKSDLTFQIGINSGDSLNVSLEKSDTTSLGLSFSSGVNLFTSERVSKTDYSSASIAASDVKINGFDAFSSSFATNLSSDSDAAKTLATKINGNTGVHGAEADAFNTLTSDAKGTFNQTSTFTINANTVAIASSYSGLVDNINELVGGVKAVLNSGNTITLSNTDGSEIVIAEVSSNTGGADSGFTVGTYTGMVSLSNLDGSVVEIEAGSVQNGYTGGAGTIADVHAFGFNVVSVLGAISTNTVNGVALTDNELSVNDVLIGKSVGGSAGQVATAINAKTADHGVTATASNQVSLDLDLSVIPSTSDGFAINGNAINLTSETTLSGIVSAINTKNIGDIRASANSDGQLVLDSASGQDIKVEVMTANSFVRRYTDINGTEGVEGILTDRLIDADGLVTNTNIGSTGGDYTLNGALKDSTDLNSVISITTGDTVSSAAVTFTITGTDLDGAVQTEAFVGPAIATSGLTVHGSKIFKTVTNINASGNAGTLTIGTAGSGTDIDSLIETSTNIAAAGTYTLTGALADNQNLDAFVTITGAADESANTFVIVGTDRFGSYLREEFIGSSTAGGTATSLNRFGTVTEISTEQDAGAVRAGTTRQLADSTIVASTTKTAGGVFTLANQASTHSDLGSFVQIASTADNSGESVTISGTSMLGNSISETITLSNASTVTTKNVFKQITEISTSAANTSATVFTSVTAYDSFVARGNMELSNATGAPIKIDTVAEDHVTGLGAGPSTSNGADDTLQKLGVQMQSGQQQVSGDDLSVGTLASANASLALIDAAIEKVSAFRSSFGAVENRLDASINNLTTLKVNTAASKSRILDADFAKETSNLTKAQILSQAATSMLAQANASKQSLLALLQG